MGKNISFFQKMLGCRRQRKFSRGQAWGGGKNFFAKNCLNVPRSVKKNFAQIGVVIKI